MLRGCVMWLRAGIEGTGDASAWVDGRAEQESWVCDVAASRHRWERGCGKARVRGWEGRSGIEGV
jgi:hypothetical protein